MKRCLVLFAMLVSLLTFNLTFFGCKEDAAKEIIGVWVLEMTRADMIKQMLAENNEMTEALAESALNLIYANIVFPAAVYRMVFTETTFEAVIINLRYGLDIPAGSGTYTVEGRTVILTGGNEPIIGVIRGKKLTFSIDGEELVLTKK